jgi:hypothetical protein
MITPQEEKICLFCLETRKGRRQHTPIEFKGLFPCECIFQSHSECIIKWQIHCLDDIECPICRVHLIVPEDQVMVGAIVLYQPVDLSAAIGKKFVLFIGFYIFIVLVLCMLFLNRP